MSKSNYCNYGGDSVDVDFIIDWSTSYSPNSTKINNNSPSISHKYLSYTLQSPPPSALSPPPLLSTHLPLLSVEINGSSNKKVKHNQILQVQYEISQIPERTPPISSMI